MRFFILILAVLTVSCSNNQLQTDWESENLKGNVKSIFQIGYNAINKFGEGEIVRSEIHNFPKFKLFDSLGNYQTIYSYEFENPRYSKCIYDENNFLIYDVTYKKSGELSYGHEIINDSKGNPIEYIDVIDGDVDRGYTKYDEDGNLILHHIDKTTEYNKWVDNRLFKKEIITTYFSTPSKEEIYYQYDNRGNLIRQSESGRSYTEIEWIFDDRNRIIQQKRSKAKNKDSKLNLHDVAKLKYSSDSAKEAHVIEWWDGDGRLKSKEYKYWVCDQDDTLTCISLNKDFNLSDIETITKYQNKKEVYRCWLGLGKCEIFDKEDFTIIDGKKASSLDKFGNKVVYEYKDKELVKQTESLFGRTTITLYKNNRKVSSIKYDEDNNVIESEEVKYKGTAENGEIRTLITSGNESSTTIIEEIKEGKVKKITKNWKMPDATTTEIVSFKYNSCGDVIEESLNGGSKISTYEYIYDEFSNWIVRKEFVDGQIKSIDERSIVYY